MCTGSNIIQWNLLCSLSIGHLNVAHVELPDGTVPPAEEPPAEVDHHHRLVGQESSQKYTLLRRMRLLYHLQLVYGAVGALAGQTRQSSKARS